MIIKNNISVLLFLSGYLILLEKKYVEFFRYNYGYIIFII